MRTTPRNAFEPAPIDYTALGRDALIAYCDRLRDVLMSANPFGWAHDADVEGALAWEREAVVALHSHLRQ